MWLPGRLMIRGHTSTPSPPRRPFTHPGVETVADATLGEHFRKPKVEAAAVDRFTLKIAAAIHWEALRLWIKGARLVPRGDAIAPKAANTGLATSGGGDYTTAALPAAGRKSEPRNSALVR
jgi:hypothetical protein